VRKYSDLTKHQKDKATDKALEILIDKLMWDGFDYQFKSVLAQKHFFESFGQYKKDHQIKACILRSDEIAEELYPIAESMAETAYYPATGEYVIEGV
jgi:hypothetical protein